MRACVDTYAAYASTPTHLSNKFINRHFRWRYISYLLKFECVYIYISMCIRWPWGQVWFLDWNIITTYPECLSSISHHHQTFLIEKLQSYCIRYMLAMLNQMHSFSSLKSFWYISFLNNSFLITSDILRLRGVSMKHHPLSNLSKKYIRQIKHSLVIFFSLLLRGCWLQKEVCATVGISFEFSDQIKYLNASQLKQFQLETLNIDIGWEWR